MSSVESSDNSPAAAYRVVRSNNYLISININDLMNINYIILEICLFIAGVFGISYWNNCFIYGHFCTHELIEVFQKLYCGAAGPLAIFLLFFKRKFHGMSFKIQRSCSIASLICLLVCGMLLYLSGYGH